MFNTSKAFFLLLLLALFISGFISNDSYNNTNQSLRALADTSNKTELNYLTYCGGCHGEKVNAFVDRKWKHGDSREALYKGIKYGYLDEGMPAFDSAFTDKEMYELADYILTSIKDVNRYASSEKPTSNVFKTKKLSIRLDTVVKGLTVPWGMAFLPDGEMLITERSGKLYYRTKDGKLSFVQNEPKVVAAGQGGMMDVITDPDFRKNRFVYLSYSKEKIENGRQLATTAILRAKFVNGKLVEPTDIFVAQPYSTTRHHYGSRMQFGKDGYLYFSVGERGNEKQNPQQIMANDLGKIHRIKKDGSIPTDNPFVNTAGASPSIYSYGHRNPQGMFIDVKSGKIWENEHGPKGGDEINIIEPGKNYGWPSITYGINYNGRPMSPDTKTAKEGMEQPFHQWTPSIAPSGMVIVTGSKYKGWTGNIMSGSLRFQYLNRTVLKNQKVVEEEILFKNIGRVRDVRMGPDGFLYIAVETPGTIYRLMPIE